MGLWTHAASEGQISQRICTVWSGPFLSTARIIGYYRIYQWRVKAPMRLCSCRMIWIHTFWACSQALFAWHSSNNNTQIQIRCPFRAKNTGPSCSKLTTSLVNDLLKFTSSDMQICWNFLLKKNGVAFAVKKLLTFFQQKISEYCILNPLKQLTNWPLTSLFS